MAAASYQFVSESASATADLAAHLAKLAEPGTVIALDGDLGAGKTTFSQHFAKALGVTATVNSPTFTLIKEYEGRLPFYHMDVYRLSEAEAAELGLDDYFYGDGVTLVEWAERLGDLLPAARLHLEIAYAGSDKRIIRLVPHGHPYERWCDQLKQSGVIA